MSGIFISYRQDDSRQSASRLWEDLAQAFGEEHVFLDRVSMTAGRWREQIHQALEHCKVVVVVIGRRWLTVADAAGNPRISLPDDVHRQEVALALAHAGVTVIPLLVDGALPPRAQDLPEDLRPLAECQAREMADRHEHRAVDLRLLIGDLERATGRRARPTAVLPPQVPQPAPYNRALAALAAAVGRLFAALVAGVLIAVLAELGLGWTLSSAEVLVIVALVTAVAAAFAAVKSWWREKREHAGP